MVDVLIAGAGPVGLFLAHSLRQRGLEVVVIEAREGTVFDPRAAVIWPRTAEVLASRGLGAAFARERRLLEGVELQVKGVRRGTLRLGRLDGPEPQSWIIEQHRTEAVLREALGQPVLERHALVGLTQDEHGVTAQVRTARGEERLRARYLVGCDGARSTVRKALDVAFEGAAHEGLECLQVNAECAFATPPTPGFCRFDLSPGATLLTVPLPERGYRFVSFRRARGELTQPTLEDAQAQLSHIAHEPLRLRLTEPRWLTSARFQDRLAARLRVGRVMLCGDAAAVWAPIGGRGMNVGLLAAHNLAWKLAAVARHEVDASLLDSYDTELRSMVKRIIATLSWNRMEYPSGALALRFIDAALSTASGSVEVPRPIERLLSLYDLDHRPSPALLSFRGRSAGARFPDASFDDGRRAHALLAANGWTLFGVGCPVAPLAGVTTHEVPTRDASGRAWLGSRPGLVLVRPDGIIAAQTSATEQPRLAAALQHLLTPGSAQRALPEAAAFVRR
ncbi:MAG: FAD-dependent monooxygenase [Myxococcus sp.]|nr:FAD-dependent monooxygenase [Myxococcus sp.]